MRKHLVRTLLEKLREDFPGEATSVIEGFEGFYGRTLTLDVGYYFFYLKI